MAAFSTIKKQISEPEEKAQKSHVFCTKKKETLKKVMVIEEIEAKKDRGYGLKTKY